MIINKKSIQSIFIHDIRALNNDDLSTNNKKKLIGSGARRIVYDIGNGLVLKVAKSQYGIKSNKREVKTFYSSPAPVRKKLGIIKSYHKQYNWVIMKKYSRRFPHLIKYKRELYKLKSLFLMYGIIPYEITGNGNPNYQNLRLDKNGKIVVIDYGNFRYRKNKQQSGV